MNVIYHKRDKILWDFKFQIRNKLLVNQPDIVVGDEEQKTAVVIAVAGVEGKVQMVPVVIGALGL